MSLSGGDREVNSKLPVFASKIKILETLRDNWFIIIKGSTQVVAKLHK